MQYDNYIARFRSYWTDRTARNLHSVSGEAKPSDVENRRDSVRDKRQTPGQDSNRHVSSYVRKTDKKKAPAEVFQETLDLINEMFPERKII